MAARGSFTMNDRQIRFRLRQLDAETHAALVAIIDRRAALGVGNMKVNAPWTDRTGAARSGLHARTEHSKTRHAIVFAHSVPYGIWLEVKNSGKYEIIMPTVRQESRALGNDLDRLWARI